MQGGTFSISSLGGIGGTAFTPIVNAPEVAILGVSRVGARSRVWDGTRVRAAADAAAVALLRPPRDRRRRRRALHDAPRRACSPTCAGGCSDGRATVEVQVPDIGDFADVPIIEVLVAAGRRGRGRGPADHARVRQGDDGRPLARRRARCASSRVEVGDTVSEGSLILTLEPEGAEATAGGDGAVSSDAAETAEERVEQPAAAADGRRRRHEAVEVQRPRHRRLHRRADHRGAGRARRRGGGRGPADHARVRQGDDGRPLAGRRAPCASCASPSATRCPRAR